MRTTVATDQQATWHDALAKATSQMPVVPSRETIDLAVLFANVDYAEKLPESSASARRATRGADRVLDQEPPSASPRVPGRVSGVPLNANLVTRITDASRTATATTRRGGR